ncbi:hypothetical protein BVRB_017920, partial [Beta vulgaris subsp. vulgaris]
MIWATSTKVGCGKKACSSLIGRGKGDVWVCQYSPAGNIVGQQPYKTASVQNPAAQTPSSPSLTNAPVSGQSPASPTMSQPSSVGQQSPASPTMSQPSSVGQQPPASPTMPSAPAINAPAQATPSYPGSAPALPANQPIPQSPVGSGVIPGPGPMQQTNPGAAMPETPVRSTIGDASNDPSNRFIKIAHNDDDQSWPETLRKCEGEGLSSQARLQCDAIAEELNLCQQWCSEVRSLVSDMVSETTSADAHDIASIESALIDIDRGHEQVALVVEAMASIYLESERHTIMSLPQEKRILLEFDIMAQISSERQALHTHIFHYFNKQRRDSRRLCGRMPSLLHHTGQILQLSCDRIFNQQRCSLLDRMTELGLDLSELGPGALYTPIRCKVALNADDCHADL